jgi:tetratricopeptide (TPR) repeat protein
MTARHLIHRLMVVMLVLSLPLVVSQCSKKSPQTPKVRALTTEETADLQALHDHWPEGKPAVPETLPEERLEIMGDLALKSRNFQSSLLNYLQILQKQPERYDLHYKVGVIFLLSGKLEAAKKELALVLIHKPKMLQAHEALGLVFLEKKDYPQAIQEFEAVLAQDSRRAKTYHLLGVTYLEAGRLDRAITALQAATRLNPQQVSSLVALARAYMAQKKYPQAVATLKQARSLAPQNRKISLLLGRALGAQKKYNAALEAFTRGGDEALAYNNIGVYYFMDGEYEAAAKCFQRAIELRPTFYQEAKNNLRRALEKLQETQQGGS